MDEPTLTCGHALSEVVHDPEGSSYCRACEREVVIEGTAHQDEENEEEQAGGDDVTLVAQKSEGADPDSLPLPFHSTRADSPGPRGCWARAKHGGSCHAPAVRGQDYCAAHSGLGISADPARYAPIGQAAHREQLAVRATMRAMHGGTRPNSPRAVLRAHVHRNAERLAGRALGAALSPATDDAKAAGIAIRLIETADPPSQATLEISADLTPEDVDKLSYSELLRVAEAWGITPLDPSETAVDGCHELPQPAQNG
jgi:hypothetical protein